MTTAGWFGAIPERWDAVPLYGIASERKIPNKGLSETNLLSLSYGRIVRKDIETNEGLLPASFETYQIVRPNDIVLRMTDLQNDQRSLRSALVGETGIITSAYLALALRNVDPRFMAYQFRAIDLMRVFYSMGGGLRQSIGFGDLKRLPVLTPPLEEQRAIADYLDWETAQIDAFIAKNEELITLLTERRASVIAKLVTRGTDDSVELRATAVEWAGDVPDTWRVGNIRRFASMKTGHTPSRQHPEYWVDCEIPWFTLADVWQLRQGRREMGETSERISELGLANSAAELLPAGTVALSRTASVGFAGIMPVAMATSQDFWNWIPGEDLLSEYLWYQFQAMKTEFERLMTGSTHRTIYQADAASFTVLVPPMTEQQEIVERLDRETRRIDGAIETARRGVELARERRAALISAAVTGKIDVGVAG